MKDKINLKVNSENDRVQEGRDSEKRNQGRDKQKDTRTTLDKYRDNGYDSGFVFHED